MLFLAAIILPVLDPVAFSIGPLAIRWYALAYVAAFVFATWYMKRLVTTPRLWGGAPPTMTPAEIDRMFVWIVIGVIAGGRLGYVLFYNPLHYLGNPADILKTWDGGMSFHGGFIGVVAAAWGYGRRIGSGLDRMLDLGATVTPIGLLLGRLANFVNAELYGRASSMPWAMVFPTDPDALPRHPSQLYEAALEGVLLFAVLRIATHRHGALGYAGRCSGIFALGYGLSRIAVEFFREPDRHLGTFGGVFTMGMLLSLPMVAVGVWLLLRSAWRGRTHGA